MTLEGAAQIGIGDETGVGAAVVAHPVGTENAAAEDELGEVCDHI